jgi:hypothetical protein
MAYIIAQMSLKEIKTIKAMGHEIEPAPMELIPRFDDDTIGDFEKRVSQFGMIFVDCDALDLLMTPTQQAEAPKTDDDADAAMDEVR